MGLKPKRPPATPEQLDAWARKVGHLDFAEALECLDAATGTPSAEYPEYDDMLERVEANYHRIEEGFQRMKPGIFEPKGG